jgi:hypothetical protein
MLILQAKYQALCLQPFLNLKSLANTLFGHLRGPLALCSVFAKGLRAFLVVAIGYGLLSRSGSDIKPDLLDWLMFWGWAGVYFVVWFIDHVLDADGNME